MTELIMDCNLDVTFLSPDDSVIASVVAQSPIVKSASCKYYCISCKSHMSSKSVSFHLVCMKCRKQVCSVEVTRGEYSDLSVECKAVYVSLMVNWLPG